MKNLALALMIAAATLPACRPAVDEPGTWLQGAGKGSDYRSEGPHAVARHALWAPARYTEVVATEVFYPAAPGGYLDTSAAPYPPVMVIHEQNIDEEGFAWLARQLASWGFVVALPSHPLNDPSNAIDNERWVLDALTDLSAEEGTFLSGGVDGSKAGLVRFHIEDNSPSRLDQDERYQTLTLVGAEPRSPSTALIPSSVLIIDGEKDCVADPTLGITDYATQRYLFEVQGMSHGQLVDQTVVSGDDGTVTCTDGDPSCTQTGCSPEIAAEDAHRLIQGALAGFHRIYLAGDVNSDSLEEIYSGWDGVLATSAAPLSEEP